MDTSKNNRRFRPWGDRRGSVVMEFVLVLPVYIAVIGGILWFGQKSLDATALRSADHWTVWRAGDRFSTRIPAMIALKGMFPRAKLVYTNEKRSLIGEHAYLQFIGSKTTLWETRPDYLGTWMDAPFTVYGQTKPWWMRIPEFYMTSSRYGSDYTQCIIMRAKGSYSSMRHWHSSLVADRKIWKFDGDDDKYPEKWDLSLLKSPKFTDDGKTVDKAPDKIEFYERYGKYETWSE